MAIEKYDFFLILNYLTLLLAPSLIARVCCLGLASDCTRVELLLAWSSIDQGSQCIFYGNLNLALVLTPYVERLLAIVQDLVLI